MRSILSNRRGAVYVIVLFIFALAFFSFLWFAFYSQDGWVTRVIEASEDIHTNVGSDQHDSYDDVTTFIDVFLDNILLITMLILILAGLVYTYYSRIHTPGGLYG